MPYPYGKKGGLIGVVTQEDSARTVSRLFRYSLDGMMPYFIVSIILMTSSMYFIPVVFHILLWIGVGIILFLLNKGLFHKVIVTQDTVELRFGILGLKREMIPINDIVDSSFDDQQVVKSTLRFSVNEREYGKTKTYTLDGISNPSVIYNLISKIRADVPEQSGEVSLCDGTDVFTLKPSSSMCFIEAIKVVLYYFLPILVYLFFNHISDMISCSIALVLAYFVIFAFLKESSRISVTNDGMLKIISSDQRITLLKLEHIKDLVYLDIVNRMGIKTHSVNIQLNDSGVKIHNAPELILRFFLVEHHQYEEFRKRVLGDKAAEIKATPDVC